MASTPSLWSLVSVCSSTPMSVLLFLQRIRDQQL
jgi:hypothetical protein